VRLNPTSVEGTRASSCIRAEVARGQRNRLFLFLGVILYITLFWQHYLHWLNPTWAYYGFTYRAVPVPYLLLSFVLALLPCTWIPLALKRPSQLIYWVIYLVVYLPSMFEPFFMHLRPDHEILLLVIQIAIGFFIMGLPYRMKIQKFPQVELSERFFWLVFGFVTFFFNIWIASTFWGRMQLVSAEDIYGQRAVAKELLTAGGLVGYPLLLLSGMLNPVLMSIGCVLRRPIVFLVGAVGQILVYSCVASKSVATSLIFIPIFYFLIKYGRKKFGLIMVWSLTVVMGVLFLLNIGKPPDPSNLGIGFQITDLIILRTIATPGQVTSQYHAFFSNHPLTYMSHVHGLNVFINYPYANSLGLEIGSYFMGYSDLNQTAHFWATDGIAGLWLPGIIIISILAALVFWLIDSLAARRNLVFSSLTLVFSALNLSNDSLFTCLLSGGLGSLMFFLYFMPLGKEKC